MLCAEAFQIDHRTSTNDTPMEVCFTKIYLSRFSISDNKLFEFSESYRTKNVSLTVEVERLKRENLDLQVKVESG